MVTMVSCLFRHTYVALPPARARGRARAFGYGLTMMTMKPCFHDSFDKILATHHGQPHGTPMVKDHEGKESFTRLCLAVATTPVDFARGTLRTSKLHQCGLNLPAAEAAGGLAGGSGGVYGSAPWGGGLLGGRPASTHPRIGFSSAALGARQSDSFGRGMIAWLSKSSSSEGKGAAA